MFNTALCIIVLNTYIRRSGSLKNVQTRMDIFARKILKIFTDAQAS